MSPELGAADTLAAVEGLWRMLATWPAVWTGGAGLVLAWMLVRALAVGWAGRRREGEIRW